VNAVGPSYFETFGIPIIGGRGVEARDVRGAPPVAVINESMARRYFPQGDAVGRRLSVGSASSRVTLEIVGVVKDVRYRDLKTTAAHVVHVPFEQTEAEGGYVVAIRTAADPAALMGLVARELQSVAPAIPIREMKTLSRRQDETLVNERLLATLCGVFSALGLLIAAIGLYGLVSYSLTRRIFELGLRIALGATRRHVLWLAMKAPIALVMAGTCIGLVVAVPTSRVVSNLLYGVAPDDAWVYWLSAAILLTVSFVATLVPAIRASRMAPLATLRYE
jgi:ABC-type antimicrobial peptide transport system permease subunit